MKKMTLRKLFGGLCCAAMMLFAASCAQGVDDETWTAGVSGVQLESPAAETVVYSYVTDASGNEQVKVQWPVSLGAGGYEVTVLNVNDPTQPTTIVDHEVVDGCSILFPLEEDTVFEFYILTLGNQKLNNAAATEPSMKVISTVIDGHTIENGKDIGKYITDWMASNLDEYKAKIAADPNFEFAFDLVANGEYTLNQPAEFGPIPVRLRGVLNQRPTVTLGEDGCLAPQNGLKIKNVNFDCEKTTRGGLIEMANSADPSLIVAGKGMKCSKPIRIESCWVRELTSSIITVGRYAWAVYEFRMSDCIVQLNMDGKDQMKTFLNFYSNKYLMADGSNKAGAWNYPCCMNMMVLNSTIYNRMDAASIGNKAYFARHSNAGAINGAFGSYNGVFDLKNSTIIRMIPNKDFGNNAPNKAAYVNTFENSIFYDTRLIQKWLGRGGAVVVSNNTIWCPTKGVDSTDKQKYATEEDPGFSAEEISKKLDLTAENGGVNFTPLTGNGDPRWLN